MRNTLHTCFKKFGFDIIRTENSNDNLSKHLQNVLLNKQVECVIDVGANTGQYGLFLREIGYKGYIVSFEPVNHVFKVLKKECDQDDKWFCYNYALGDTNEEKTINVYKSSVFSSFLKANEYSKNIWSSLNEVIPENVTIFRLDDVYDDVIGKLNCTNHLLKLDTQGFDHLVFEGSMDSLKTISALQFELSLIAVYDGMPEPYSVLKEFHENNFYISGMYPINRDESLAVIEFDCVLVKKLS